MLGRVMVKGTAACCALALTAQQLPATPDGRADPLAPTAWWTANTRGAAQTPPMGWNSWNAFATLVDEDKVMGTARALVDTGLAKLGYRYVNIDDGWWLKRRTGDGRILIRTGIFPSAAVGGPNVSSFRPLTDRLHAMGLKAGLYTDIGLNSCGQSYDAHSPNSPEGTVAERQIGLLNHMEQDARLFFGEWGFDYIKVDACGIDDAGAAMRAARRDQFAARTPLIYRASLNRTDIGAVRALYSRFAAALAAVNPDNDYILSICLWGSANVRAWGKDVGNLTRTSDDIRPLWGRMLHSYDSAVRRPLYAHPGSWNDPDMLFIGHGDFDADHLVEARAHFTLWAMLNAPLLIGYDMRRASRSLLEIWGNADLIRANQDPGGHQAVLAYDSEDAQILVKTLGGSDRKVAALLNRTNASIEVTLTPRQLRFADDAPIVLRDLWTKKTLDPFTGARKFTLAPHQALAFEASGTRSLGAGYYLSELPGLVNVAVDGVVRPMADPTVHRSVDPWGGTVSSTRPIYGGWSGAGADESPYQMGIAIGGAPFDTGIGILANSRMEIRNEGRFDRFETRAGVDDNSRNTTAAVRFEIYGDGRLIARSKPMRFGTPAAVLTASTKGVRIVELVVRQDAERTEPVAVAWADAQLR